MAALLKILAKMSQPTPFLFIYLLSELTSPLDLYIEYYLSFTQVSIYIIPKYRLECTFLFFKFYNKLSLASDLNIFSSSNFLTFKNVEFF